MTVDYAEALRDVRARTIADRILLDDAADVLDAFAADVEWNRRRLLDEHQADREIAAAIDTVNEAH